MKQFIILIAVCTLLACHHPNKPAATVNMLKGDWAGPEPGEDSDRTQTYFFFTDSTYGISIVRGDSALRSIAYGHYHEPIELHLLLMHLKHLYKHTPLQPDSSVNERYFFSNRHFPHPAILPPPPVNPNMLEFTPPNH